MEAKNGGKPAISDYAEAFLDFLRRPKTVFEIKDRLKAALLLTAAIILLQEVVRILSA